MRQGLGILGMLSLACAGNESASDRGHLDAAALPPFEAGTAWLEIGTGESSFQSLSGGGAVDLELGPQGSWMTLLSLRGNGFVPEGVIVDFRATLGGDLVGNLRLRTNFDERNSVLEATGLTLIFDQNVLPSTMAGQDVIVAAALTDADDLVITAGTTIRPEQ